MIRGVIIFGGGLIFLAAVMNGAANWLEMQPTPENKKFAVVDTYKGCDVIRWNPEYKYFLYCDKK